MTTSDSTPLSVRSVSYRQVRLFVLSFPASREYWARRACAVWPPRVFVRGKRLLNVIAETRRSRFLLCSECKRVCLGDASIPHHSIIPLIVRAQPGASIGCKVRECRYTFHYCAKETLCRLDKCRFKLLCPEHAVDKSLEERPCLKAVSKATDAILQGAACPWIAWCGACSSDCFPLPPQPTWTARLTAAAAPGAGAASESE